MAWQKEVERWLDGNIPMEVNFKDLRNWLLTDPLWSGHVTEQDCGSHQLKVHIDSISHFLATWKNDTLSISTTGGTRVKKWIVEQVVKGYELLEEDQKTTDNQK